MNESQEPKYQAVVCDDGETRLQNRATGETIPDEEPIFILRAKDIHAVQVLQECAIRAKNNHHQAVVCSRIRAFRQFAKDHPERMKEPDTDASFPL